MKKWKDRDATDKKYFIVKIVGALLFLGVGLAFGLVAGAMSGWYVTEMVKDPRLWLGVLCGAGVIVMILSTRKVK